MRRYLFLLAFGLIGCSTAPLAGFLDVVRPARIPSEGDANRDLVDQPPPGGVLLPPQGVAPVPQLPQTPPIQSPMAPPDGGTSPGPLRVPNT